jgi:hypothetical protein
VQQVDDQADQSDETDQRVHVPNAGARAGQGACPDREGVARRP